MLCQFGSNATAVSCITGVHEVIDSQQLERQLTEQFEQFKANDLTLNLTRGKPSSEQLDLSNALDGILQQNYATTDTDTRNYGGIDGLPTVKSLFSDILKTSTSELIIGGNSSLTLMHQTLMFAQFLGLFTDQVPWSQQTNTAKIICPVPGYDRHFSICTSLGIDMITVEMTPQGPDMDTVEQLVKKDASIKGIWNVPRFSNTTGITYSDAIVQRMAQLPKRAAASDFIIMWDNAYAIHSLKDNAMELASIDAFADAENTHNHIVQFASTSKVSFAGSGISALACGPETMAKFKQHLSASTIGPDKVNQLRHIALFGDFDGLTQHMKAHADILAPRFDCVLKALEQNLDNDTATWTTPNGGYFISLNTRPGLAKAVIEMCDQAGVQITPAGATFPYGNDPHNRNIRIAPSFASLEEIQGAMDVLITCIKLATVRQELNLI
ncbi:MAG: aminotransferase class I/II-fold pyridoxal phosphate-dependent enzyme [Pseudomonadota bacterium]